MSNGKSIYLRTFGIVTRREKMGHNIVNDLFGTVRMGGESINPYNPTSTENTLTSQQTDGHRKIVVGPLLADVGGSHIDDDAALRDIVATLQEGRHDTLLTFAYCAVGKADETEVDALLDAHFERNGDVTDTIDGTSLSLD